MGRYSEALRPVWAEIDLRNIGANIRAIKALVGSDVQVMAVVKAEGYGHGAVRVAQAALAAGASCLGVALPEEGITLRKAGFNGPILVFGILQPDQAAAIVYHNLTASLCQEASAAALSQEAMKQNKTAKVHVKVDSGMGRVGAAVEEAVELVRMVSSLPGVEVEGIYSHFATADAADLSYAKEQLSRFKQLLAKMDEAGFAIPIKHMANSGGIINLPDAYLNLVRPGIAIYGLYPSEEVPRDTLLLRPALSLKTRVVQVKRVPPGTGISYGQIYHTERASNIASIPIGYADGWSRILTGKAWALLHGKRFPIVGRICMDQCMIDAGDEAVEVGDEVVLIGEQGDQRITADEIAGYLGTINYEVVCMISDRVPRVYLGE